MKVLIGVACVAVIAFVGYYFWGEMRARQDQTTVSAQQERARQALFDLANAKPNEAEKVRLMCKTLDAMRDNDEAQRYASRCRSFGYL